MFQVQSPLKTGFTSDRDEGEKGLRSEPASPVSPKTIKLSTESTIADGSIQHNTNLGGPYSAFTSWKTNLNLDSAKQLLGTGIDKLPNVNEYSKHWLGEHGAPYPLGTHSLGTQGLPMPPVFAGIMQRRKRRENRPRRQRTTFTSEQTLKLELEYNRTEYISRPRRYELAEILNLSENQIKIWFQNRRAKEKRIEKAHQDQQIRSSNLNSIGVTPFSTSGSYSVFCGPCVWPYPPGTLTNVLSPPTKSN